MEWHGRLRFQLRETLGDGAGGLNFRILTFGDSRVMVNAGGKSAPRRSVRSTCMTTRMTSSSSTSVSATSNRLPTADAPPQCGVEDEAPFAASAL